ncbi:hypothetical protein KM043_007377 [Ampulex compressa]|nr:hypothetical protein KM043_007377 [Ampulex compressa]
MEDLDTTCVHAIKVEEASQTTIEIPITVVPMIDAGHVEEEASLSENGQSMQNECDVAMVENALSSNSVSNKESTTMQDTLNNRIPTPLSLMLNVKEEQTERLLLVNRDEGLQNMEFCQRTSILEESARNNSEESSVSDELTKVHTKLESLPIEHETLDVSRCSETLQLMKNTEDVEYSAEIETKQDIRNIINADNGNNTDNVDVMEPVENTDSAEFEENSKNIHNSENITSTDNIECIRDTTSIKNIEVTENIENVENCETIRNIEHTEINKTIDNIAKTENSTQGDTSTPGKTDLECQVLLHSYSQNSESTNNSVGECVKSQHESCISESSTIVTDTELKTLVDQNSEVVVLTVETLPSESCDAAGQNYVVTVHEKDVTVSCDQNNIASWHEKDEKTSNSVNDEYDIIDYSQESDGTIIEVISTEVVQREIPDTCVEQETKLITNDIKSDICTPCKIVTDFQNKVDITNNDAEVKQLLKETTASKLQEQNVSCTEPRIKSDIKIPGANKIIIPKVEVRSNMLLHASTPLHKPSSVEATTKKRSVIQDIFDDWGDENAEEETQTSAKDQDTVEIELKSLLDEAKTSQAIMEETVLLVEEKTGSSDKDQVVDTMHTTLEITESVKEKSETGALSRQITTQSANQQADQNIVSLSDKQQIPYTGKQSFGKSAKTAVQDSVAFNPVQQLQGTPAASRGRNLTSQIASQAEVTEALKERLREKQKIVEPPRGPDIFFVKKITQRLSSKLAGGPVSPIPALIPLPHPIQPPANFDQKSTAGNTDTKPAKDNNSDNKELLAILEGDVDPDWSNLKPPILTEEGKSPANPTDNSEHNTPPKLDPLVERELALKQLLELPITPMKRNASRKRKTFKPAPNKVMKDVEGKSSEKKDVDVRMQEEVVGLSGKDAKIDLPHENIEERTRQDKESESTGPDVRADESRSGRKRKPTEKAREHEQYTTKRQKVYKGKVSLSKKQSEENITTESSNTSDAHQTKENIVQISTVNIEDSVTAAKEIPNKQFTSKVNASLSKIEASQVKRAKQNLSRKGAQSMAKRKMVVKISKLRQKISPTKKPVNLKAKLSANSKKSGTKMVPKSQKRPAEPSSVEKPKKKIINEIDRLLQDEGVVNLLYDVEQPDKKRLIPITKSQAKVMDIQKVQRELKIRKKLVRNAVLRLRTSTSGVTKVSPRSKRATVHVADSRGDKKHGDQVAPLKSVNTGSPTEFVFPAKIRNAADASIIIRRHSSSSFSSASGSPRVSVDGPEKSSDNIKTDEGGSHSLRSMKRRHSQEERLGIKKSKKKVTQKNDLEATAGTGMEEKTAINSRPSKKADVKKTEKSTKQIETINVEESGSSSKVTTRSNGAATGKVTSKSKKATKSKVTFVEINEPDNNEESSKDEDELSACLAEAATALSVVNANNRSGIATVARKNKVNANVAKVLDIDSSKVKTEMRSQFSNKEINVRRHGYLVQLILTPSSSTKIRNALTLQLMQEFRETLSILKKDDECRVVLLTSTGTSFCEGLELSMLLHANKDERRIRAEEMADSVKDFIKTLASFNKPIVAGVQGAAVGLGVTMLPLFDLVIASDKATFNTPYGKLGQIAEGAAVFTLSQILGSAITSELLLGGRTLTASEALRAGLVTRVLWPDRFQVELLPTLRAMSEQSSQVSLLENLIIMILL